MFLQITNSKYFKKILGFLKMLCKIRNWRIDNFISEVPVEILHSTSLEMFSVRHICFSPKCFERIPSSSYKITWAIMPCVNIKYTSQSAKCLPPLYLHLTQYYNVQLMTCRAKSLFHFCLNASTVYLLYIAVYASITYDNSLALNTTKQSVVTIKFNVIRMDGISLSNDVNTTK